MNIHRIPTKWVPPPDRPSPAGRPRRGGGAFLLLAILAAVNAGCLQVQSEAPPPPSPTVSTPTPTIVIPTLRPTETATPEPSPTPTPDIFPGLGPVLYYDRFDRMQEWDIPETNIGGAGVMDGRFSVSVRRPNARYIILKPEPLVSDFYMEALVRAEVCSEDDEFGLVYRANEEGGYYRFTLACSGEARVSRTFNGTEVALMPKTTTHALIPGLLVDNRIAVLAQAEDFRFFINDTEVFSLVDRTASEGMFGFFVRSRKDGQTTVSFDNLLVRDARPELMPTPSPTPTN